MAEDETSPDGGTKSPKSAPNDKRRLNPDLTTIETRKGALPGDVFARINRTKGLQKIGTGHFIATEEANIPQGRLNKFLLRVKRFFIGRPLLTAEEPTQRLSVTKGLAVFGSDPISSAAYATEAALAVLIVAGNSALKLSFLLALAISSVLIVVAFSYRQTIQAYPQGGGSYTVSRENLGQLPGLVAASALLIDYVLTVAVSIVAGVQAIISALLVSGYYNQVNSLTNSFPTYLNLTVVLTLFFIGLMVLTNLRGIRESGTIFSIPAYAFIIGFLLMLAIGLFKAATGTLVPVVAPPILPITQTVSLWLVLRAFSAGSVAMTGTEAVSNGVQAFQSPETKNAAKTLTIMALLLGIFFLGLSYLALHMGLVPGNQTIISQAALAVFGNNFFYYAFQIATMGILIIAGNTAFADFPRLSSVLAKDGFMPHQFQFKGDRLAFSTGIIALGIAAAFLVLFFKGNINHLIQLYAIGVFLAFSMSEAGMVVHWWRKRNAGWRRSLVINAVAGLLTSIVLVIVAVTKFDEGGWIVTLAVPAIVISLLAIRRHYDRTAHQLGIVAGQLPPPKIEQVVILPIDDLNYASLRAMSFVRTISTESFALHVSTDPERAERLREKMKQFAPDFKLVVIDSPTSSFVQPMITYVNAIHSQSPETLVTLVFPEFIPAHWWEQFLHNRTARRLYHLFEKHPNVAVVLVPYLLQR